MGMFTRIIESNKLFYKLSRLDVPYTLVPFPQFTRDYDILYQKLNWLFEGYNIDRGTYNKVMDQVVDPKKIHKFD